MTVSIYPVTTPLDEDEKLIAVLSHEISAGFDAVLQAGPPTAVRISAALGAVAGTAAAVISMMPRQMQALCLSAMVKAIRLRLKEYQDEPPMSAH